MSVFDFRILWSINLVALTSKIRNKMKQIILFEAVGIDCDN